MRVLHLFAGNLFGGVETLLGTLARCRHLCPGLEPEFGHCFPGRAADELRTAGVPVHPLGAVRLSRPWTGWAARRRLARVLAGGRFDAVLTHGCWPHAVFAPAVRRAGVRLANMVHDVLAGTHPAERRAARTPPDVVLCNSRFSLASAARVFPAAPAMVWHPPVPAPAVGSGVREAIRAELGTPAAAVVVVQVGRLERWKGAAVTVDAAYRLAGVSGWEVWLVGGPQKSGEAEFLAELRTAVAGQGGRVRFLGQRADVPAVLAAADVYCQPNTGPEPFGLALVEALYAGRPVVASALGGPLEIVDESCGLLCPPGDVAAVAAALGRLIADPALRRALGAAGPGRAAELCDPATQLGRLRTVLAPAAGADPRGVTA